MALTKAARGIEVSEVTNTAVRNILTGISRKIFGRFTEHDKEETFKYFNYRCPYTDKPLDPKGGYDTDHIIPQNKDECGLNIIGNLLFVDKTANSQKKGQTVEHFLLTNDEVLKDVPMNVRIERLNKIREFQKKYQYDSDAIKKVLQPYFAKLSDEIKASQQKRIDEATLLTGLRPLTPIAFTGNTMIRLVPSDVNDFKKELLIKKQARRTLTYDTGRKIIDTWDASNFTSNSNVMNNIKTSSYYKKRKSDGLVEVLIEII